MNEFPKVESIGMTAYDMPNGLSSEIKYPQNFVRPSMKNMPKDQTNSAAKMVDHGKAMGQVLYAK